MKQEDISSYNIELKEYLMKEFNYKRLYCSVCNATLCYNTVKIDLYIRWQPNSKIWKDDTLVIARIGFQEKRKGHGTDLLNFIVSLGDKYNYKKIVIECANDNSSGFARHHGFQQVENTNNWVLYLNGM